MNAAVQDQQLAQADSGKFVHLFNNSPSCSPRGAQITPSLDFEALPYDLLDSDTESIILLMKKIQKDLEDFQTVMRDALMTIRAGYAQESYDQSLTAYSEFISSYHSGTDVEIARSATEIGASLAIGVCQIGAFYKWASPELMALGNPVRDSLVMGSGDAIFFHPGRLEAKSETEKANLDRALVEVSQQINQFARDYFIKSSDLYRPTTEILFQMLRQLQPILSLSHAKL